MIVTAAVTRTRTTTTAYCAPGVFLQNTIGFFPVRALKFVLLALFAVMILPACVPLAATGAMIGASLSVDRRTVGAQIDDQTIQLRANQRIKEVLPGDDKAYAYVTSHNRRVLLTGLAPDAAAKARAEQIAASTDNVRGVYNELNIGSPGLLSSSSRDTLVTARVRSALFQDKAIEATAVRVVTELRTVYLMGVVTRPEGEYIAKVASQISGVDKVITIFDFISEQDLNSIQRERAKAAENAPAPVSNQ
jgi:osmotically-inducible protein OsmY